MVLARRGCGIVARGAAAARGPATPDCMVSVAACWAHAHSKERLESQASFLLGWL